jgi:hypothetical protein
MTPDTRTEAEALLADADDARTDAGHFIAAIDDDATCDHCKRRPAVCIGRYEDDGPPESACNKCCGHGNEDGWCMPIGVHARDLIRALLAECDRLRAERDAARAVALEACDVAEEGWAYAGEYFRDKWDAGGRLANLRMSLDPALTGAKP